MKIHIEKNECTGCEWCVDTLPDVFELGENKIAVVKNYSNPDESALRYVVENCPAECIIWSKE